MSWTTLLNENNEEIGIIGDSVWDLMGVAVDKIVTEYQQNWDRLPYQSELESILEFVTEPLDLQKEERAKKYNYFISFKTITRKPDIGIGHTSVVLENKISSYEDVLSVEEQIKIKLKDEDPMSYMSIGSLSIDNFILLRVE